MKSITAVLIFAAVFATSARGQGLLNLGFESANNLPANPPANGVSVGMTNALPDWTAYDGLNALVNVYYISNNFPGGYSTAVELEGGNLALSGNFSAALFSNGSISQTGLVPDNAESLQFEAHGLGPGGSVGGDLSVTIGGEAVLVSAVAQGPDYIVYGANIPTGMDGQVEALTFDVEGPGGEAVLDNIEFSTSSVPEPGECGLIGVAAVLVGVFRWRRQRRDLSANCGN